MQSTGGEGIPIDGKRVRGLRDGRGGIEPLHRVSAGASRNRLVLGRDAVEDFFTTALGAGSVGVKVEAIEAVDKGEGRLERRRWAVLRCGAGHDCPLVPPASSARERRWAAIAALLLPLTAVSPWALLVLAPPFFLDTASGGLPGSRGRWAAALAPVWRALLAAADSRRARG